MADYKLFDNFLTQNDFEIIKEIIIDRQDEFPWYAGEIDYENNLSISNKYNFQLSHTFYTNNKINSDFFFILHPIIYKLGIKKIFRIKANLNPVTEKNIEHSYHIDIENCTTAVYYVNTNNGYTIFEDGQKIESVENRILIFNSNQKHSGASCTNTKARYVINFNYLCNEDYL